MNKLKVLLIPDSFGWAFEFSARGVKKYSKHDITIRPFAREGDWKGGLTPQIVRSHDVIFLFSRWIWDHLTGEVRGEAVKKPLILYCCGTSFGKPPECVTAYAVCTERLVKKSKAIGITNPVLLKQSVDTEIFKPTEKPDSVELRVGWAGNPKQPTKRYPLLSQLKYPVKTMTRRDRKFLVKNRSRQPMVDFYNSLDVYVIVSSGWVGKTVAHGVGLTVLEAMACGLPVVSTDNCDVSSVLQPQWLVPIDPGGCIEEMNKKLTLFDEDRELMRRVGARNLEFIHKERSWKTRVKEWDELFETVSERLP